MESSKCNIAVIKNQSFEEHTWCNIDHMKGDRVLEVCIYRSTSSNTVNDDNIIGQSHEVYQRGWNQSCIDNGRLQLSGHKLDRWLSKYGSEQNLNFKFNEFVRDHHFKQHIMSLTRFRNDQSSILDLILTTEET